MGTSLVSGLGLLQAVVERQNVQSVVRNNNVNDIAQYEYNVSATTAPTELRQLKRLHAVLSAFDLQRTTA